MSIQIISGGNDYKFVDSTITDASGFDILQVNADCVFTVLTGTGGENLLTQYGLSGKTVKQGSIIKGRLGGKMTTITVSSGSVHAYKST